MGSTGGPITNHWGGFDAGGSITFHACCIVALVAIWAQVPFSVCHTVILSLSILRGVRLHSPFGGLQLELAGIQVKALRNKELQRSTTSTTSCEPWVFLQRLVCSSSPTS